MIVEFCTKPEVQIDGHLLIRVSSLKIDSCFSDSVWFQ